MYHAVLSPGDPGEGLTPGDREYAVGAAEWEAQLKLLAPLLSARTSFPVSGGAGEAGVEACLTFDDSWKQHFTASLPVLRERGLPAAFFITTGQLGRPGMLTAAEVAEIAHSGFVVGSHGATHRLLNELSESELLEELSGSRARLEEITGAPVETLSLPGGRGGRRELDCAFAAGYKTVFTSRPGLWDGGGVAPRVAMKGGAGYARLAARLAAAPENTVARLAAKYTMKEWLRRLFGEQVYGRLYSAWSEWGSA